MFSDVLLLATRDSAQLLIRLHCRRAVVLSFLRTTPAEHPSAKMTSLRFEAYSSSGRAQFAFAVDPLVKLTPDMCLRQVNDFIRCSKCARMDAEGGRFSAPASRAMSEENIQSMPCITTSPIH